MTIETADLILMPYPAKDLLAIIDGQDRPEGPLAVLAAEGLRRYNAIEHVSPVWLAKLREFATAADPWVNTFAIMHRQDRLFAGGVGYTGPPDEQGIVEIAYGIEPAYQGRGYATQAAEAGTAYAFADERVRIVRAHTLPNPNASTRVLTKCGFTRIGEIVDPEDGPVWRWEHPKQSA
jgi:RimJ/RimL family protein N-acetyltransferase